jgi:hypothetical protein
MIKQDIRNYLIDDIKKCFVNPYHTPYVVFMGIFLTRYQFTAIYF